MQLVEPQKQVRDFSAVPMMISDMERGEISGATLNGDALRQIARALRGLAEAAGVETPPPYDPEAD